MIEDQVYLESAIAKRRGIKIAFGMDQDAVKEIVNSRIKFWTDTDEDEVYRDETYYKCTDCGCSDGELHEWGCQREHCPFTGITRLGFCDHCEGFFSDDIDEDDDAWNDADEKLRADWEKKGRFPYIYLPNRCQRCGEASPFFFYDPEWDKVIDPMNRDIILCLECYSLIKERFKPGSLSTMELVNLYPTDYGSHKK